MSTEHTSQCNCTIIWSSAADGRGGFRAHYRIDRCPLCKASPDLLAAAQEIEESECPPDEAWKALRAAIVKATSER